MKPRIFQERMCGPDLLSRLMCRDGAYKALQSF